MRTLASVVTCLALILPIRLAHADNDPTAVAKLERVFSRWDSPDSAGCSVGVAQDGRVTALRAFGSANLEQGVANTVDTVFEIGSLSKQFTATAILMLADEGRLGLADDVRKYIPELPDFGVIITVDHLLTHTSGLRDWGFVDELSGWGRLSRTASNRDALDITVRQRVLNYPPGTEYSYTNTGYTLLAIIAERVSGMSLPDFTRQRMFVPLRMNSTQWRDDYRRLVANRAIAYRRYGAGKWFRWMANEDAYGDTGVLTTAGDLLKWNAAQQAGAFGPFVARELVRTATLTDGTALTYARGLQVDRQRGTDAVWHLGGMFGYRAALARYAERNLSIAIVCNAGDIEFGEFALLDQVAAQFLSPIVVPSRQEPTARIAPERAGLFVNERSHMPMRLIAEAGVLREDGGEALEPRSSDRFTLRGSEVVFIDRDRFTIKGGMGSIDTYRRVAEPAVGNMDFEAMTGRYYSPETGATYRIVQQEGQLALRIERHPDFHAVLRPAYANAFVYDTRFGPGTAIIRFMRDADNNVSAISVGWNLRVRDVRFERFVTPDE